MAAQAEAGELAAESAQWRLLQQRAEASLAAKHAETESLKAAAEAKMAAVRAESEALVAALAAADASAAARQTEVRSLSLPGGVLLPNARKGREASS